MMNFVLHVVCMMFSDDLFCMLLLEVHVTLLIGYGGVDVLRFSGFVFV